jgi:alpha-beta hydrolase superfamily lysophospholipase
MIEVLFTDIYISIQNRRNTTKMSSSSEEWQRLWVSAQKVHPLIEKLRRADVHASMACNVFTASDGFPVFYRVFNDTTQTAPVKNILCIHGMHSHGEKFVILADEFAHRGWQTFAIDLRGHGLSWQRLDSRGDIDDYMLWIKDIVEFVVYLEKRYPGIPVHVVSESMGSAVAIHAAKMSPAAFKSLVLLSPALQPWPEIEFGMILESFTFAFIAGSARGTVPNVGKGRLTTNSAEFIAYQSDDPLRLPSISPRYYYQIVKMIHQLNSWKYRDFLPTSVFYGEKDHLIKFDGIVKFVGSMGKVERALHYIPGAMHDLLTDRLAINYSLYKGIVRWIDTH